MAGVFDNFTCDVAERPGETGELLVGGVLLCEKMSKRSEEMDADAHAKVSDDNVTVGVLGAVENVLESVE